MCLMLPEGNPLRCSRLNTGEPRMGLYHAGGKDGGARLRRAFCSAKVFSEWAESSFLNFGALQFWIPGPARFVAKSRVADGVGPARLCGWPFPCKCGQYFGPQF